ncbi:MAG: hypothetical protein AAFQ43_01165 [Bacteroidota bacterium]
MFASSRTLRTRTTARGTTLFGMRSAPAPRRLFGSWDVSRPATSKKAPTRVAQ